MLKRLLEPTLVAVAAAMIDGDMNLIEGVRRITALRNRVEDPDDEIFMPIRAIESETDHFPLGGARDRDRWPCVILNGGKHLGEGAVSIALMTVLGRTAWISLEW